MTDDRLRRRQLLRASVGIATVAGCIGNDAPDTAVPDGPDGSEPADGSEQSDGKTTTPEGAGGWPMFGQDLANSGYNEAASAPPSSAAVSSLAPELQPLTPATVGSDTVVVGGVLDGGYVVAGISRSDGSRKWTHKPGQFVQSTPAVVDGTAYFGAGYHENNEGQLYALDVDDGTEKWSIRLAGPLPSDVAVWNGRLYAGTLAGRQGGTVTETPDGGARVFCLDRTTGDELWSKQIAGGIYKEGSPVVDPGTNGVYFAAGAGFLGLDASTGEPLWSSDALGHWSTSIGPLGIAESDGTVVVNEATGLSHNLYAVDLSHVVENPNTMEWYRWSLETDDYTSHPTIADGTAFYGTRSKGVSAVAIEDGSVQWSKPYSVSEDQKLTVVDETVFVATDDGIVGIDAADGSEMARFDLAGTTKQPISAVDSTMYIVGDELYEIR